MAYHGLGTAYGQNLFDHRGVDPASSISTVSQLSPYGCLRPCRPDWERVPGAPMLLVPQVGTDMEEEDSFMEEDMGPHFEDLSRLRASRGIPPASYAASRAVHPGPYPPAFAAHQPLPPHYNHDAALWPGQQPLPPQHNACAPDLCARHFAPPHAARGVFQGVSGAAFERYPPL
jgi:hypothetical protein